MHYDIIPSKYIRYVSKYKKITINDNHNDIDIVTQLIFAIIEIEMNTNELYRHYIDENFKISNDFDIGSAQFLLATYINLKPIEFDLKIELCKLQEKLFGPYNNRYKANNDDFSCYRLAYINQIELHRKSFEYDIKCEEIKLKNEITPPSPPRECQVFNFVGRR
jgi:hypothetical protein